MALADQRGRHERRATGRRGDETHVPLHDAARGVELTTTRARPLADAIRVERMALDSGPSATRNLGALAREVRRTQLAVSKIENRLQPQNPPTARPSASAEARLHLTLHGVWPQEAAVPNLGEERVVASEEPATCSTLLELVVDLEHGQRSR